MFSSIFRLRCYLVIFFFFTLVLASSSLPTHLSHAQAPIDSSAIPDSDSEFEVNPIESFTLDDFDTIRATATVPAGIVGVWKGNIHGDPDFYDHTFSALITLIDGDAGEMIGTAAHPSIECGGEMRLQDTTSDTIITTSDYTFGHCLDGTHMLKLDPDGRLLYEWHDPHSSRVDRGTLTKVGGVGTAIPSNYTGVWEGTVTQVNPSVQWPALVALANGNIGSIVGTFASPTFECGGELVLQAVNIDSIVLLHDITYGDCVDNGTDTLRLVNDNTLNFHWRSPSGTSTASGDLTRISGAIPPPCILPDFGDANGNPLRQRDTLWDEEDYGGTDYDHNGETIFLPFRYYWEDKDTIANWGCYLTSAAMIVNYYAEQQGQSFRTDPKDLNTWLQHNDGYRTGDPLPNKENPQYVNTSGVNPYKVAEYARAKGIQMSCIGVDTPDVKTKETVGQFIQRTQATVNASMCALNPIIMGVTGDYGQHYVDATGSVIVSSTNTWRLHDPEKYAPTTLYNDFSNSYNQIVRFSGNLPNRVLSISIHSPVEVILTDPEGRRTGYDPRTNISYRDIPGSSYGVESLTASDGGGGYFEYTVLDITLPILGGYILEAIGTDSGSYTLEIMGTNNDGVGKITRLSGETSAGRKDAFLINYSSSTGQPIQISELDSTIYLPIIIR